MWKVEESESLIAQVGYVKSICSMLASSTQCEKCPYSEFFCSLFSPILTEYGEIIHISPYSVQIWQNTEQKTSDYGHFSRSATNEVFIFVTIIVIENFVSRYISCIVADIFLLFNT